ncbi:hypothetical protein V6N13_018899 [Hibiscus sabdariffa]
MKGHVPIIEPTSSLASVSSSCLLVAAIASDFQLGIWAGLLRIFETGNVLGQSRKWKRKAGFATIDGGGCAVIHGAKQCARQLLYHKIMMKNLFSPLLLFSCENYRKRG